MLLFCSKAPLFIGCGPLSLAAQVDTKKMKISRIIAFAAAAAEVSALVGCAADFDKREESIKPIDANLWLYTGYLPYETRLYRAREYAAEQAVEFCRKQAKGSQPLEGTNNFRKEGGIDSKLVFRCVTYLPAPAQPFEDHSGGGS